MWQDFDMSLKFAKKVDLWCITLKRKISEMVKVWGDGHVDWVVGGEHFTMLTYFMLSDYTPYIFIIFNHQLYIKKQGRKKKREKDGN